MIINIPIEIGTVELTFGVDFPNINFDCDFTGDGTVIPSNRYHLGSIALSWEDVSLDIPLSAELPISGHIDFSLDRDNAECVVSGSLNTLVKDFPLGEIRFPYLKALRLVEPDWSRHTKLDLPSLQAKINAVPASQYKSDSGATGLQTDEYTQDLMRGILTFAGAGDFLEQMMDMAVGLKSAYTRQMNSRASNGNRHLAGSSESDVLIAIAVGATAGLEDGVSQAAGLFFDSSGVFGTFGTFAQDMGFIASISAGVSFLVYWPVKDERTGVTLSALDCFSGFNLFVAGDIDLGIGAAGTAVFWPASAPNTPSSQQLCGLAVNVGPGIGLPLQFYEGNSVTLLLVKIGAVLTIFSVTPLQGSVIGGTQATIQGTGFKPGLQVTFGNTPVQKILQTDDQSVSFITPSHDKGIVDITVTLNGHSAVLPHSFDYS